MIGNRRLSTLLIGLATATLVTATGSGVAAAQELAEPPEPDTVVIDGREYGPEDGLTVLSGSKEIVPSSSDDPQLFDADFFFGSSYASTREIAYLFYRGTALAAGNLFQGQRIIQVCIQYTGGAGGSPRVCSNAVYNGVWRTGAEASVGAQDTLDPNAVRTRFNYNTVRVAPGVTP